MTDVILILRKLQRLREQIQLARARRPATAAVLSTDLVLRDALALALLVAAQEAVDIAYHVAADEAWGVPDSHAAAFRLLAEHGVISSELAVTLSGVARVRNRIAHGYMTLDHERMWQELPAGLDALEELGHRVASWLPAEPEG
jgi:uncharacterized protein YutE (UPF0331/DUF86 family)